MEGLFVQNSDLRPNADIVFVQYLFLIYGAVTVLFGILVIAILPTTPQTAWFFTQAERERVAIRLADNQQSKDTKVHARCRLCQ